MYEVRLFPRGLELRRRWTRAELAQSIESAKAALTAPGDRAEVWTLDSQRPVWRGLIGDNNAISETIGG